MWLSSTHTISVPVGADMYFRNTNEYNQLHVQYPYITVLHLYIPLIEQQCNYMHRCSVLLWEYTFATTYIWTYLSVHNLLSGRFCNESIALKARYAINLKSNPTPVDERDLISLSNSPRQQTLVCVLENRQCL